MNLVLSERTVAALEQSANLARSLGLRVTCLAADLRRRGDVEMLAQRADAEMGGIAVLVNNAGMEGAFPYDKVELDSIEEMIALNLTAPMLLTRLLLPAMIRRGEGHVVNISSLAGLVGTPYEETYSATKHGLVGFTRSLNLTLKAEGHPVGASVICPAFVEEAGMYRSAADATGGTAPMMIGTVSTRKVAQAVVRAIVHSEPEVVLSGKPMLPFLIAQTLSPRLAARMSAMVGVPATFKKWADAALRAQPPRR